METDLNPELICLHKRQSLFRKSKIFQFIWSKVIGFMVARLFGFSAGSKLCPKRLKDYNFHANVLNVTAFSLSFSLSQFVYRFFFWGFYGNWIDKMVIFNIWRFRENLRRNYVTIYCKNNIANKKKHSRIPWVYFATFHETHSSVKAWTGFARWYCFANRAS